MEENFRRKNDNVVRKTATKVFIRNLPPERKSTERKKEEQ